VARVAGEYKTLDALDAAVKNEFQIEGRIELPDLNLDHLLLRKQAERLSGEVDLVDFEFNNETYQREEQEDPLLRLHRFVCQYEIECQRKQTMSNIQFTPPVINFPKRAHPMGEELVHSGQQSENSSEFSDESEISDNYIEDQEREGSRSSSSDEEYHSDINNNPSSLQYRRRGHHRSSSLESIMNIQKTSSSIQKTSSSIKKSYRTSPKRFTEAIKHRKLTVAGRPRKRRTVTTEEERDYLERMYEVNPYPTREQYEDIRKHLKWKSSRRVTKWFNNKRYNSKARTTKEK